MNAHRVVRSGYVFRHVPVRLVIQTHGTLLECENECEQDAVS
eukprot:COSAG03_NODE_26612_length_258_cov_0.647799_1_plen_41_part_01